MQAEWPFFTSSKQASASRNCKCHPSIVHKNKNATILWLPLMAGQPNTAQGQAGQGIRTWKKNKRRSCFFFFPPLLLISSENLFWAIAKEAANHHVSFLKQRKKEMVYNGCRWHQTFLQNFLVNSVVVPYKYVL